MGFEPGLQRTGAFDVEGTRRAAESAGYATFVMPSGVSDRASFFDAVRATLPLDPPVVGEHGWDGLSDSLWEGLRMLEAGKIAILWPSTGAMETTAPSDFDIALSVLRDVATSLADSSYTHDNPKTVAILVE